MPVAKVYDSIIKSAEDKRAYRGLELTNGLKVLLISDPGTDKAAASMDVRVGCLSDPKELPGLAHFCEHMLFMGTEKYPTENDYNEFLSTHSGMSNASTDLNDTNYHFDVDPKFLEQALDRFSQFFICPLFTESATDREINAVNSEHEKNLQSDNWRMVQLEKSTSDPSHDYSKFGTGNKLTLDTRPQSLGLNVREELLKFHKKWYSSNLMGLAVLGKESLDELTNMVEEKFSLVENRGVEASLWPEHPFGPEQLKKQCIIVPVKDIRLLTITFPLPDINHHYRSRPDHYLSHLIGDEGPGSLLSELKARGWINALCAGYRRGSPGFGFFIITTDLTEEGIEHPDEIVEMMFQYLQMLRDVGPQEHVFTECRDLSAMIFRFKDMEEPSYYTTNLSLFLHEYPMEEVACGGHLLHDFRPDLINELLQQLTPDHIRITLIGKKYEGLTDAKEQWYNIDYKLSDIPEETLEMWKNCGVNDKLCLPKKNEFIPTNFDMAPPQEEPSPFPSIIKNTAKTRVWFKQDDQFLLPKTAVKLEFENPLVSLDPLTYNAAYMFTALFKDALNEYTYAATLANLSYSLNSNRCGLTLCLAGYNHKLHILLDKIMDKMVDFTVDPKRYEILKESYMRTLRNFEAELPYRHCQYYTNLLLAYNSWTKEELLETMDELTIEEIHTILPKFFSRMHIEALVHGNVTKQEALSLINRVESKFATPWKPLLPCQVTRGRTHRLEDGSSYLLETVKHIHSSAAVLIYYQCGAEDSRSNALVELFCQLIQEPCFNILRTQEQLGYIVCSGMRRVTGVLGIQVLVQSNYAPLYVDSRIEAFLLSLDKYLDEMTEDEFETHKDSLISQRLKKPKKLLRLFEKFWSEISTRQYKFERDNIEVACLKDITKEDIIKFYKELIAHNGLLRKKMAVHIATSVGPKEVKEEDKSAQKATENVSQIPNHIQKILNIQEFKNCLGIFPSSKPWMDIPPPAESSGPTTGI